MIYRLAADLLLLLHAAVVAFVVFGLMLILVGAARGWRWVRNPWFRLTHVLCIGVVALQAWLGRICPLTTWEMALRERAGDATYDGAFVAHWIQSLMYFDVPVRVFAVVYTLFGALVVASWVWVRPRPFRGRARRP